MDRPSWAPVILSGAIPRELSDLIAIAILDLTTIQLVLSQNLFFSSPDISWVLILIVPLTAALAALSNSRTRELEELALVAYGGSTTQIGLRYILRGGILTAVGLFPLLIQSLMLSPPLSITIAGLAGLIVLGGTTYATPAFRRTRSLNFVEQYKG